jgi:hypothetical protein
MVRSPRTTSHHIPTTEVTDKPHALKFLACAIRPPPAVQAPDTQLPAREIAPLP